MWNLLQNSFLILCIILFSGCATAINTTRVIPARASEVTNYKTVAFLNFTGNQGIDASSKLESTVIKAEINGNKQYSVVDRKNINQILQEQQFQMTIANQDRIIDFGQLIGAEAIWYGNAQSNYTVTRSYETRSRCLKYNNGVCSLLQEYIVPCENRQIVVNVSPKLSSVATGKVVYSRDFQERESSYSCSDSLYQGRTEGELYNDALLDILYKYRLDIAPYIEHISIEIMNKKNGTTEKSLKLLKNGIEFAKSGRMEKACQLWSNGILESPESISLNYNMGVCSELLNNYEDALKFYLKAEDNTSKPIKIISKAIARSKENISNEKKIKSQM